MSLGSEKPRTSISRKLPGGKIERRLPEHNTLTGEVIWAWNELHQSYCSAFAHLVDPKRTWIGSEIWTALNNDSAQRDVLKAILTFLPNRTARNGFLWAIRETGKLSVYRNDAIHGVMGWLLTPKGAIPNPSYFGNSFSRVLRYMNREKDNGELWPGPNFQKLMFLMRGDLMQLASYVSAISRKLDFEKSSPWPRRPRLRAHKYALRPGLKNKPRKRVPRRRTQPKPSQA